MTRHNAQFEETEPASEPASEMARILELSDKEFKATLINMLKALMRNTDNMQDGQCERRDEILRDQKPKLETDETEPSLSSHW